MKTHRDAGRIHIRRIMSTPPPPPAPEILMAGCPVAFAVATQATLAIAAIERGVCDNSQSLFGVSPNAFTHVRVLQMKDADVG